MKKILITGITGFVGSHLAEYYLKQKDVKCIIGLVRRRSSLDNINHLFPSPHGGLSLVDGDITDAHSVEKVIKENQPDIIHHLAAQSFVKASWIYPIRTFEVNVLGTINLFEAIRKHSPQSIVHIASSSEIYGIPTAQQLITENMLPRPISPYGVSKLAADRLGFQYYKSYEMKIIITRAFNHSGPRRGAEFAESSFCRQIALIENGKQESEIKVGNLESHRDYTDVRDICEAYDLAVQKCMLGIPYNICSGETHKMEKILDIILSLARKKDIKITVDQNRLRPSDLVYLRGSYDKFNLATNWRPKISLTIMLHDLLDYWREKESR